MAKIFTYIIISVGLLLLLYIAGIQTITGAVIAQLGISNTESLSGIDSSALGTKVAAIIAILIGTSTAIVIGTFGRSSGDTIAWATVASSLLVLFTSEFCNIAIALAKETEAWIGYLLFVIMAPFIVGYVIAIFDWIKGQD